MLIQLQISDANDATKVRNAYKQMLGFVLDENSQLTEAQQVDSLIASHLISQMQNVAVDYLARQITAPVITEVSE